MANHGADPRTLALALLAIPASVITNVTQTSGQFGPWEIPVGLLIICVTLSYEDTITHDFLGTAAFSIICAAGFLFVVGFIVDGWIGRIGTPPARMSAEDRNWLMVAIWLGASLIVWLLRTVFRGLGRRSSPVT